MEYVVNDVAADNAYACAAPSHGVRDDRALEVDDLWRRIQVVGYPEAVGLEQRPSGSWVSKTDLMRYVRCPYAFWLLERGEITFDDTVDEFQLQLLQEGHDFQERVEAGAIRLQVEARELQRLLHEKIVIYNVPTFRNTELRIHGQPDGVDASEGALLPIEMKSHKDVQRTDELELAFYWLLLEPFRTRDPGEPRGYVILRRDGLPEQVDVRIPPHRFDEVHRLLVAVRLARLRGVRPRICGCHVCSEARRQDVLRSTLQNKDLTLVVGIGRHYAAALEAMGIGTWEELLGSDTETIVLRLRDHKYALSEDVVERWKRHAECWRAAEPFYFGSTPFSDAAFIALDLEYGAFGPIWLIGACVVHGAEREYVTLWADDSRSERRNLRALSALAEANPSLPIVTWSGNAADVPQMRAAAQRLRLGTTLDPILARHCDLFCYARDNIRLPIPSLGLKDVAEYWGIPRISSIRGGMQAQMLYGEYVRSNDRVRRAILREDLEDYNRDDLDALVAVSERIRDLTTGVDRIPDSA